MDKKILAVVALQGSLLIENSEEEIMVKTLSMQHEYVKSDMPIIPEPPKEWWRKGNARNY